MSQSSSSKRLKLGQENTSAAAAARGDGDGRHKSCKSHHAAGTTALQIDNNGVGKTTEAEGKQVGGVIIINDSGSESEGVVAPNSGYPIPDTVIFKYCLGGLADRATLLKDLTTSASEEQLLRFANEVSLYSGCPHHRRQIIIAKRLIEEGMNAWNSISQKNGRVPWENVVFEIADQFVKTACCSTRSLTEQDFELLRRIAGCTDYVAQENFEKLWCWLYPIAVTLSRDRVNAMWNCTSPKWIEGLISKEEAELSLRGPRGLQEPGTFVLRFPTSRSWPHPDAGSLIVTYVGRDYTIHHRLLSLDYIFSCEGRDKKTISLQDMLLAEPELSRFGRIVRRQ
ncbi:hypothetical protein Tsubulata_023235 [Turnera subulata]|uniref:SH2 domain-containing protein n=1 Tax=Turnera subulata TaxID=218843 RepID=A0A9Q0FY65_9ROSI|nr:hypothetical protein Tsubulata_023235 [Turnera subulata]